MSESKITQEVADAEFNRFVEAMDLDVSPDGMDADDRKGFEKAKRTFVNAVLDGSLVVDEKGQPVFKPKLEGGGAITFPEPKGSALMAMDQKKKDHVVAKSFATLAEITGEPQGRFALMPNRDLKVCTSVMLLFLA